MKFFAKSKPKDALSSEERTAKWSEAVVAAAMVTPSATTCTSSGSGIEQRATRSDALNLAETTERTSKFEAIEAKSAQANGLPGKRRPSKQIGEAPPRDARRLSMGYGAAKIASLVPVMPPAGWTWSPVERNADQLALFDLVSIAGKGAASVVYEAVFKPENYVVALKKAVP
jgi:hypothetical protein